MSNLIIRENFDNIAILKLNRPKKLNALNYAMNDAILAELSKIEQDDEIKTVILTGVDCGAFSAGGDIHEFSQTIKKSHNKALTEFCRRGQRMTSRIEYFSKPIIVAVNGIAYGGGCEITEAAHLAIASDQAIFAKPEIKIGIPPTFGGTQRLSRLAGRKKALHLLLTGDRFSAVQAQNLGLINKVVPHELLLEETIKLAQKISQNSAAAAKHILSSVTRGLNTTIEQGLLIEQTAFSEMMHHRDCIEYLDRWQNRKHLPHAILDKS